MRKFNYLLVMPRLVQNIGDGYSFPLGITYISSNMKKAGYNVFTLNLNHIPGDVATIIKNEIKAKNIDVVATGGLSFQYNTVKGVVEAAKSFSDKIITIVGGGIISGDAQPAMQALEYVDYGVIGEGDVTIVELCSVLEQSGDVSCVDGIIFKKDNHFIVTKPRKELDNIDVVPWPDYKGFGIDEYLKSNPPGISGMNRKNIIFMLASRSCPYGCTFCFHTVGRKYRQRSIDGFFEELDYMVATYDIRFICLADELFARDLKRVKEFCERIKKYNIRWWAQFRVDDITTELLDLIKDGGCEVMSFGLESADNRILKSMKKYTTVEQIEKTLKLVHNAGISFEGAFIFGDIEETNETANNTLDWWRGHSEYKINLNLITVYPGTYLYKYACEKGIIADRVKFLKDGCPQVNVSQMTDDELSQLVMRIMEIPFTLAKTLTAPKIGEVDYKTARFGVSGECVVCKHENNWNDIKSFATNFLSCAGCGQRYNISLFPQLRANIDTNIAHLIEKYGKVAIWGINYHTSDLFKYSTVLKDERVYPVDISKTKRMMNLYGKTIYSPEDLNIMGIEAVIIAIPVYFTQIASQIEMNHKQVKVVIDICSLVDPEFNA